MLNQDSTLDALFDLRNRLKGYNLKEIVGKNIKEIKLVKRKSLCAYLKIKFQDGTYLAISSSSLEGGTTLRTAYFDGMKYKRKEAAIYPY